MEKLTNRTLQFEFTLAPIAIPLFKDKTKNVGWTEYAYSNHFIPFTIITDSENIIFKDIVKAVEGEYGEGIEAVIVLIKYLKSYEA